MTIPHSSTELHILAGGAAGNILLPRLIRLEEYSLKANSSHSIAAAAAGKFLITGGKTFLPRLPHLRINTLTFIYRAAAGKSLLTAGNKLLPRLPHLR